MRNVNVRDYYLMQRLELLNEEKSKLLRKRNLILFLSVYTLVSDFDITIIITPLFKPFRPLIPSPFLLLINNDNYFKQFSLYIQPLFTLITTVECLLKERRKRQKQTEEKKKKKRKLAGKKGKCDTAPIISAVYEQEKMLKRKLTENIVLT